MTQSDPEAFEPQASETAVWWGGMCHLEVTARVTDEPPLGHLVSNFRALILDRDHVVFARSRDGQIHLPGGRVETGEQPLSALARELREEVGVRGHAAALIGRIRFRHLTPKPAGYPYPYPVFEQVVYLVTEPEFDSHHVKAGCFQPTDDHQTCRIGLIDAALGGLGCLSGLGYEFEAPRGIGFRNRKVHRKHPERVAQLPCGAGAP